MIKIPLDLTLTPENATRRPPRDINLDTFRQNFEDPRTDYRNKTTTQTKFFVGSRMGQYDLQTYHQTFFDYVVYCWAGHRGVVITPDIIWFGLMCEIGKFVKEDPEKWRHLFSKSSEKQQIIVPSADPVWLPLHLIVDQLRGLVPSDVDTFLPKFSTSNEDSTFAFYAAFADIASSYYDYGMLACGIPQIILEGTQDDWRQAMINWEAVVELFQESDPWFAKAHAVLTKIFACTIEMAGGDGNPQGVTDWFKEMFVANFCGSGGDIQVKGWLLDLFRGVQQNTLAKAVTKHIAQVEYKNFDTNQEFIMSCGVFSSTHDPFENIQNPFFGSVVVEKRKEETRPWEIKSESAMTP